LRDDVQVDRPSDWETWRQAVIAEIGPALALAEPLHSEPLPTDPEVDYREAGSAPARLLAGLGPLWMRAQYLWDALGIIYNDPLMQAWQRLERAVLNGDRDASEAAASEVHNVLAQLDRRLSEIRVGDPPVLPTADYETRRLWLAAAETSHGVAIQVRKQARALCFATSDSDPPVGWEREAPRPSMSAIRERLARIAGLDASPGSL
jgi:hypothetical protein